MRRKKIQELIYSNRNLFHQINAIGMVIKRNVYLRIMPNRSFLLVLLLPILTACPPVRTEDSFDKFVQNKMDLTNLKRKDFKSIHFQMSDSYEVNFENNHLITNNPFSLKNYGIGSYFAVEQFKPNDLKKMKFYLQSNEQDSLRLVQNFNSIKRTEAMMGSTISFPKTIFSKQKFKGILQTIEGPAEGNTSDKTYFLATFQIDGFFYTFSMISDGQIAPYLYDDFLKVLASIEK